jgi:hypothetical protein
MTIRRLQFTSSTAYAMQFDVVCMSTSAIVPAVFNILITGIIPAGLRDITGEPVRVLPLPNDYAEIFAYIQSVAFTDDIEVVKAFAQAQGAAFVTVEPFGQFVQPSATLRSAQKEAFLCGKLSLPLGFRALTKPVLALPPGSDERARASIRATVADIASGSVLDVPLLKTYEDFEVDDVSFSTVPLHSGTAVDLSWLDLVYHMAGSDSRITTRASALGVLFPMFVSSDDTVSPDFLDLATQGRIAVRFENQQDLELLVTEAFSLISKDISSLQERPLSAQHGTVDTRTGNRNLPSYPQSDNVYQQSPSQIDADSNVPNQNTRGNQMGSENRNNSTSNQAGGSKSLRSKPKRQKGGKGWNTEARE